MWFLEMRSCVVFQGRMWSDSLTKITDDNLRHGHDIFDDFPPMLSIIVLDT